MGRKKELGTVQILVSILCSNQNSGITRKALIETIESEHAISERSIDEALSILNKSGILRKTSEPFGARLRIDLYKALKEYRNFQLKDIEETTNNLPERMKEDIHYSFVKINNAVVEGEIDFIKTIFKGPEFWRDYPEEAIGWAISIQTNWIMRFLKVWKSRQKI